MFFGGWGARVRDFFTMNPNLGKGAGGGGAGLVQVNIFTKNPKEK